MEKLLDKWLKIIGGVTFKLTYFAVKRRVSKTQLRECADSLEHVVKEIRDATNK